MILGTHECSLEATFLADLGDLLQERNGKHCFLRLVC